MRCWRRQGRRILRGAPDPGVVPHRCTFTHPHPGRGTHRSSARARPPGWAPPERVRARADSFEGFVSHPQVSNGAKSNDTSQWLRHHHGHHERKGAHARRTVCQPTLESTMYGTKSIAPTYSALFRFAAYLKIDLNTYLVSRAPHAAPCIMWPKTVSRGRQPHLPARGTPLPRGTRPERMCVALRPVAARTHRGQILKTFA